MKQDNFSPTLSLMLWLFVALVTWLVSGEARTAAIVLASGLALVIVGRIATVWRNP